MRHPWIAACVVALALMTAVLAASEAMAATGQESIGALPRPVPPANRFALMNPSAFLATPGHEAGEAAAEAVIVPRGTITDRMTSLARAAGEDSPFYGQTWLTYYGRPGIPVMGILGEHEIEDLTPLLRKKAREYDIANGRGLSVVPAFHLVYGMATVAPGDDDSHLAYLEDEVVMDYIEAAEEEGFAVILDVQIGALSPTEAISPALPYLAYEHVHLAIDPEFAMVHEGQGWPGDPIGYVTGEQVNEVQSAIQRYMRRNRLEGTRVLLVHQFQSDMIVDADQIDASLEQVAVAISVDGWGGPWAKITKYNSFVTPESPYAAFKLFYQWDEPLLTPEEAIGMEAFGGELLIDVTPNMVIYQ